jgi:TetR/AcrR family transcriptional regulator
MARPIAADHQDKRTAIRKAAARVFAEQGYDRAAMSDVAAAFGVSKALLYHYYATKDALLFDIVKSHLLELVETAEAADDAALPPPERLARIMAAILECYRDADAEHKIRPTSRPC